MMTKQRKYIGEYVAGGYVPEGKGKNTLGVAVRRLLLNETEALELMFIFDADTKEILWQKDDELCPECDNGVIISRLSPLGTHIIHECSNNCGYAEYTYQNDKDITPGVEE